MGSAPLLQQEEGKNNDKNTASFEFDEEESSIISANKNFSNRKIGEKSTFFQYHINSFSYKSGMKISTVFS